MEADTVTHTWSGPGTFDPQTGTSVTWIPPSSNGNVTITVTASDSPLANDTDKTDPVILTVQNTLYYVDTDTTGTGDDDGSSWTDAFDTLQEALAAVSSGDEIWVAEGTYKPTTGSNRAIPFELVDGVGVYGGFDATETARSQRDWVNNETILSGDIGTPDDDTDNSYHVVYSEGCDTDTVLDGFTLTAGNANSSVSGSHNRMGSGMCNNDYSSPTVTNCTFSGNATMQNASAIWMANYCEPTITNCVFFWNVAPTSFGGTIFDGGASSPGYGSSIINCTFVGNVGSNSALYYIDVTATLTNSILWG